MILFSLNAEDLNLKCRDMQECMKIVIMTTSSLVLVFWLETQSLSWPKCCFGSRRQNFRTVFWLENSNWEQKHWANSDFSTKKLALLSKIQSFIKHNKHLLWLIRSGRRRTVKVPLEGQHIPPLRVGDFIRTFPFNTATLKASRHTLDVKIVIQELHKLTAQLAAGQTVEAKSRSDEEKVKQETDVEDEFESLFWGPKEPPLISQCLKPV